ncbi:MAG: hypothetical protein ABJF89_01375 [Parasphingorhabdus sp.]|uniref:hypothetical protein n=1 Tax=Parasphingorhabdus sp. TaxID=2709688 RepID=UPI0032660580
MDSGIPEALAGADAKANAAGTKEQNILRIANLVLGSEVTVTDILKMGIVVDRHFAIAIYSH